MALIPTTDDELGAQLAWADWAGATLGRIWPWVLAALGVLIVVVGAVAFSPNIFG